MEKNFAVNLRTKTCDEFGPAERTGRRAAGWRAGRVCRIARLLMVNVLSRPPLVALQHHRGRGRHRNQQRCAATLYHHPRDCSANRRTDGRTDWLAAADERSLAMSDVIRAISLSLTLCGQFSASPAQRASSPLIGLSLPSLPFFYLSLSLSLSVEPLPTEQLQLEC